MTHSGNRSSKRQPGSRVRGPVAGLLPTGDTPPSTERSMPSVHRERVLPLVEVGSIKFEELCHDVIDVKFPDVARSTLKRERGQKQFGVDVEGFDDQARSIVVISAKCYRDIKGWHFRPWIEDFLKELDGHWKGKGVEHFVLAVTHKCNDDDMADAAKELIAELRAKNIQFHLWDSKFITDLLISRGHLIHRYFYEGWFDVLSVAHRQASPGGAIAPPHNPAAHRSLRALMDELLSVTGTMDASMGASLESAIRDDRAGRSRALREWLALARGDQRVWDALDPDICGKALRAMAALSLRDGDVPAAEALIAEADGVSPAPDRSAHALMSRARGSTPDAIALLAEPQSPREREIQAGLLIEVGDLAGASAALAGTPAGEISSETLRLRAVVALLNGDHELALRNASTAVERSPGAVGPLLVRGAVHLFGALADGVRPQFSGPLEPIHPGLLREPGVARRQLDLALADFDQLLAVDRPLLTEIESWRLGCLLLHPDSQRKAALECQRLLRREPVDPTIALWSASFGHVRRLGKVKKSLGDAVRLGRGTPTHLVVLAVLSAGMRRLDRGRAVIARYQHRFPEARGFLDVWRIRFGDQTLTPGTAYEAAIRAANADDPEPLTAFLCSEEAAPIEVMAGADFFASRSDWRSVAKLRAPMVRIATPRAFQLACVAALRVEDADGCLAVLKAATGPEVLSSQLIGLRIRANEALGRHQPVIDDLRSIRRRHGDDPIINRRLMDQLLKIGALPAFAIEAKRSLDAGELDPRQALMIAHTMRLHDRALARQALQAATELGIDAGAAQAALMVAADLGVQEIHDDMLRLITRQADSPGTRRLETVEELVAFINDQNSAYRENFSEWLRGTVPAAVAMQHDLKAFARLFLADAPERLNQVGDRFPMLLLSGARRNATCCPVGERPILRVDVSALLLSARLELLDALESGFSIQTPGSLGEALIEIETAFDVVDASSIEACRSAVAEGGPLRVEDSLPPGATALERASAGSLLDPETTRKVAVAAYRRGYLNLDQLDGLRSLAGVAPDEAEWKTADDLGDATTIFLTRAGIQALAARQLLVPLARATPLYVERRESDALLGALRVSEGDSRIRAQIARLRSRVSDRLLSGAWTSIEMNAADAEEHGQTPPHLRCLLELLSRHARDPQLLWVEDRVVSHTPLELALCVSDIMRSLRCRALVDAASARRIAGALVGCGYSYLPVDDLDAMTKLREAPDDAAGLIETPQLTALRVWYAQELERIVHLDQTTRTDEEGRVAGEVRRLLDLDIAHDVLVDLWKRTDLSDAEKRARSDWAWTHLRAQLPPSAGADDRGHLRGYAATMIARTLTVPFLGELDASPMERSAQQSFVDWFMGEVVAPLEKADRETHRVFVEIVARMIRHAVDVEEDKIEPELKDLLERRMKTVARRFGDLLPDRLRETLLEEPGLREVMGREAIMVLRLPDQASVPVAKLDAALAHALEQVDGAPAPIELVDGGPAEARLEIDPSGTAAALVIGDRRYALDQGSRIVLDPRRERRVAGMEHLVDPGSAIGVEDYRAAMELASAEQRFARINDLRDDDFYSRLSELAAKVDTGQRPDVADLDPPSLGSVMAFMQLTIADDVVLTAQRLSTLCDRFGEGPAFERVCSAPFSPTSDAMLALGALAVSNAADAEAARFTTPLQALLALRATLANAATGDEVERGVLLFKTTFEHYGRLFTALVRYGSMLAGRRSDWLAGDAGIYTACLWCYADQTLRSLGPPPDQAEEIARFFARRTSRTFADVAAVDHLPAWARSLTCELTPDTIALTAIAALIEDGAPALEEGFIAPLQEMVGRKIDEAWWPQNESNMPPPSGPDACWAIRDPLPAFIRGGWLPADYPFADRDPSRIARRLIRETPIGAPEHMRSCLLSLLDVDELDEALVVEVRSALAEDPVAVGLEPEMIGSQMILSAWAEVLGRLDDTDTMSRILDRFARHCAAKWPSGPRRQGEGSDHPSGLMTIIAETALAHAMRVPAARGEQLRRFALCMRSVAEVWPAASNDIVSRLHVVADSAEAPDAYHLFKTSYELRARP